MHRLLLDAVDERRLGQAGGLENRRRDVDHVMELGADLAARAEASGPVNDVPLRVPPKCEATCLVHWYGVSVAWAQPTA